MIIVWTVHGLVFLMIIVIVWKAWRKASRAAALACMLILVLAALAAGLAMGTGGVTVMLRLFPRHPRTAPAWQLIHPMEWVPAYEWIVNDPQIIGPGLYRKTYRLAEDSGAAVTIAAYTVRDAATGGYRVRVQARCTHAAAEGWFGWTTWDQPTVHAEHLEWPGHDLIDANDEAASTAGGACLLFPDLFAWDGDPASLYAEEGL